MAYLATIICIYLIIKNINNLKIINHTLTISSLNLQIEVKICGFVLNNIKSENKEEKEEEYAEKWNKRYWRLILIVALAHQYKSNTQIEINFH